MINYNLIDIIVSLVAAKKISYHNDTHDVFNVFLIVIELYGSL